LGDSDLAKEFEMSINDLEEAVKSYV